MDHSSVEISAFTAYVALSVCESVLEEADYADVAEAVVELKEVLKNLEGLDE